MASDFLEKLVQDGVISRDQLAEAQQIAANLGVTTEEALVKLEYVDAAQISSAQADQFGYESVNLDEIEIPQSVIEMVPESVARENIVLPLALDGDALLVALHDPMRFDVLDKLRFILNREIKVAVAPKDAILNAINRHYGQSETESVDSMLQEFTETSIEFSSVDVKEAEAVGADDSDAPIVKLVNLIIDEAMTMRASDIHIEPFEDRIRIRYRIDGALVERDTAPRRLLGPRRLLHRSPARPVEAAGVRGARHAGGHGG
ncbi:MAG TPA: hypothetical protein EYP14_03860, partial [Planctomycetaceae bacterium]|nr:hypothetical protein [Planctomycetaceae bacterium]